MMIFGFNDVQASGQCVEQQELTSPDAAASDQFGWSVSISGDTAVVGSLNDDCIAGENCGAAFVYRFNGTAWLQEQKLTVSDAAEGDHFGMSVSINDDVIVVGAFQDNCIAGEDCGSAYVFRFNGTSWVEEQKIMAADSEAMDAFGASVSVAGGTVIVGARSADCAMGANCGAAYVFTFDGTSWSEKQKLTASDVVSYDFFGWSVAMSGDTAVIGMLQDDCAAGPLCGAAYVFRFNGAIWVEEQKLRANGAGPFDLFGFAASVSGNTVVVGAYSDDCLAGEDCGSAYVFRYHGAMWVQEQRLTASDAGASDRFGISVSVDGGTLVVGAELAESTANKRTGAVYVYRFLRTSWVEEHKLTGSPNESLASFGLAVSVSGNKALVGAPTKNCALGNWCGTAYFFNNLPQPGDVTQDSKVDLADHAFISDCATGPQTQADSDCICADIDSDGDVDLIDWGRFQTRFSGS
jgi:FG-GAP repeat